MWKDFLKGVQFVSREKMIGGKQKSIEQAKVSNCRIQLLWIRVIVVLLHCEQMNLCYVT